MKTYIKVSGIIIVILVSLILLKYVHIIVGVIFFVIGVGLLVYYGFIKKRSIREFIYKNNFLIYKLPNTPLGNALAGYFTHYIYCCKTNIPFIIEIDTNHKSNIIKHLPKKIINIKVNIEKDTKSLLEHLSEFSLWESKFNDWKYFQPIVSYCIKNSLEQFDVIKPKYECVIHFRCADTPFIRHSSYHLLKYNWYYKAIKTALQHSNIQKIHILSCNIHNEHPLSYLCNNLVKDLQDFILKNFKIPSIVLCNSVDEDFSIMYHSKILISTTSSLSFFTGLASDNLFILPTFNKENDIDDTSIPYRKNMVFIKKDFVKHSDIVDYSNIDNVIEYMNSN